MLHVHRSERTDALIDPLATLLATPPDDPFLPDVVAVPTRGVERWLAQRLSHRLGTGPDGEDGVCANVLFPSPTGLVSQVLSAVLGVEPRDDPWRHESLTWTLLEVVDQCAGEPWCQALGRHLGVGPDGPDEQRAGRRLAVARHLARLFADYGSQRPQMLRSWASGSHEDGAGAPVSDDLRWQPELWRRVRVAVGTPSPAERLQDGLAQLTANPESVDLPHRLSVFGPTRLPQDQLAVLDALARERDVHLWLPHPSPVAWREGVVGVAEPVGAASRSMRRREFAVDVRHPLLASMGRDALELQHRLRLLTIDDHHHPAAGPPDSLLGALQQRLRMDDPAAPAVQVDPKDRSVQVHACHGRARQVEVLREVLVGLMADDPTLQPRDVLVMCPDIEAFAPLVTATFGVVPEDEQDHAHPGHRLRVRLADRSLRQTNPVLSLVASLLDLADARVTVSEVLDLAASAPVRQRFGFHEDDVQRIRHWAVTSGVRWGEDPGRRARFGLAAVGQGTWQAGLDRVLLGAAMAEEGQRFVGSALPLDDVDSTDIDLAGRLAELVDRLAHVLDRLQGEHPVGDWADALDEGVALLADATGPDAWQLVQAREVLAGVREAAEPHGRLDVRLPDVRSALADRLKGRPTRAGFRTGALTICSLEPMRAVPHRVVCLLGLDDGTFPRGARVDGDDVLLRDPCVGERDPRSEDRQMVLDAVMSAAQTLVVLYSGADERTGARRPPAVPVSELLDALDATGSGAADRPVRKQVVVRHPLAAVDERNFLPGVLGRGGAFSFDSVAYAAAQTGRADRVERPPFLTHPLPAEPRPDVVDLDDLVAALEHPVRWFLRRRLQLSFFDENEEVQDRLPLELSPLDSWQVGDRLLAACLTGADRGEAVAAEWRRGEVPPRELGRRVLEEVADKVQPLAAATLMVTGDDPARVVDVHADLPSGGVVTGTVRGAHGDVVVRTVYSRLAPKHRLRAWVQLLALVAAEPDRPWQAVTIGRPPGRRASAMVAQLSTPDGAMAARWLEQLVRLREKAAREPLPMPIAAACSYATSRFGGDAEVQSLQSARQEWNGGFERTDEAHVTAWGVAELDDVLGAPLSDEQLWYPDDASRFGVLARRVWDVLLRHEAVTAA